MAVNRIVAFGISRKRFQICGLRSLHFCLPSEGGEHSSIRNAQSVGIVRGRKSRAADMLNRISNHLKLRNCEKVWRRRARAKKILPRKKLSASRFRCRFGLTCTNAPTSLPAQIAARLDLEHSTYTFPP